MNAITRENIQTYLDFLKEVLMIMSLLSIRSACITWMRLACCWIPSHQELLQGKDNVKLVVAPQMGLCHPVRKVQVNVSVPFAIRAIVMVAKTG